MDHRTFQVSPGVRASVSADGLILLDVSDGVLLASNDVGARIWQLLDEQCTSIDIAHRIANDYAVSPEEACRDVGAFIDTLLERRLILGRLT
jgi:hypothetical protein